MTPSWTPSWPLGPQVGPYKRIDCPSFSDHLSNSISDLILERFRTQNRSQNRSKINQKILPKSTYKQVLFQLHLQSNFEDNLMFKQNGRFSKIVPKPNVFACFLDIRSCQPKQTRDMQRIEKSPKTMSKNQLFFYRNSAYFRLFLAPISKSEIKRLGEGLGLDFGLDLRPCWGPKRRPNGIKNSSRKKMPTWA